MFRVEPWFNAEMKREQMIVVDHEREVSLRRVAGNGPQPGDGFLLTWGGRQIPFNSLRRQVSDPISGEKYYLTTFGSFGLSMKVEFRTGVRGFTFIHDDEHAEAKRLAAEALLVYGDGYNGLSRPDGYNRVALDGIELRLSDFGMEGASA